MKKLTLFFACIALATSFNCSQAMAGFAYTISSATSSGFVTPATTATAGSTIAVTADISIFESAVVFELITQNVGGSDPESFAPFNPSVTVSPGVASNIQFVSAGTSGQQNIPLGDQAVVGFLTFNPSAADNDNDDVGIFVVDIQVAEGVFDSFTLELTAVPEPTTLCMFGVGMVGLVARRRRNSIS